MIFIFPGFFVENTRFNQCLQTVCEFSKNRMFRAPKKTFFVITKTSSRSAGRAPWVIAFELYNNPWGQEFLRTVECRIHIIGGPGSGKSYLAAKLAERLNIPAYDLDELYWDSTASRYGIRADPSQRDRKLADIVSRGEWIIEGVYYQWLGPSFDAADYIIALMPSIWIRHCRVVRRFLSRKVGRASAKRESLADLWRLLIWSQGYDRSNLIRAHQLIAERGRKLVECRTFNDVLGAVETPDI